MTIAILIDAENVQPVYADQIFSHAASLGSVPHREIFGAAQALTTWVEPVLKYAIHPNLTIRASKGKNSSDIALVIGAMDLLLAGGLDAVVIASSDSDFSALSVRLRNAGVEVIGMGTEKANPLWRTACSSFVVLQQPAKPAPQPQKQQSQQSARQPQQPARQQAKQPKAAKPAQQPAAQPAEPAKPAVAATHSERAAIIRALIQREIEKAGGRLQTNALFTVLNNLPEYRVDQQRSRRRPLNYLTRQYADAFVFEDAEDGNSYMSIREAAPQPADQPDDQPAAEEPAAEAPAVEPAPEAEPASEPYAPAEPAAPAEESDPTAVLVAAGFEEDVARQITAIFTESGSLRAAYNRLRTTFGSTTGREYYQRVKEIAGGAQ